ncbi:hypothetical protein JCM21714_2972 [Gracilibacillus boraciitolerans JCM 21714]|uniref:DUF2232 domain-containing protein n=1 Tax=Gracilibacillus boraciitolerans JCM 21714 TaxID=1298598 RepID=W4VKW5_9BACI|nr:hypothetical protein [Gracilibacillus boraciitolerans]GAE93862.1 hypothetical protein JCM21714_2972 [Gracilibacillus boraciitolerans JCM 21714]
MVPKSIKIDFFLYIGLFFLLVLAAIFIPFLSGFMIFLLPLPIILVMKQYQLKWAAIAMGIMFVFSLFVFPYFSIPLTVLALISGGV